MQLRALIKVKVAIQFTVQSGQVCLSVGDLLTAMHLRAYPNVGQMQCIVGYRVVQARVVRSDEARR